MLKAVQHLCALPGATSVVLQGEGEHFSVGGNPYTLRANGRKHAGFALSLRELYAGFLYFHLLSLPIVGAVHGKLVGGGVAGCLHADYLLADRASTFEHGNLVRGVNVLGMLSQTFLMALGPHAQHVYLQNAKLDAAAAHAGGLVDQLCVGSVAAHSSAREVAGLAANATSLIRALRCHRTSIDPSVLAREALGHAECQVINGGFAKSRIQTHTSMLESHQALAIVAGSTMRKEIKDMRMYMRGAVSGAEFGAEEQLLWHCLTEGRACAPLPGVKAVRAGAQRPKAQLATRSSPPAALSFDRLTGVAVAKLGSSGAGPLLEAALFLLASLGPALSAVELHVACTKGLSGSARTLEWSRRALDVIQGLGVPVTSSAEHAAQNFAAWLAAHPPAGKRHMLNLTRCCSARSATCPHDAGVVAMAALLDGAGTRETKLRVAGRAAQIEASLVCTPRSMCPTTHKQRLLLCPARLISEAPCQLAGRSRSSADVRALEVCTPRHCVSASALQARHGCVGSKARDLLTEWHHVCGEDEDAASLALAVVQRLMRRGSSSMIVGTLHVSATLLDRSKSLKTELMTLIKTGEAADGEGVDHYRVSQGELSALASCVRWAQSSCWDGRWAVAVCSADHPAASPRSSAMATAALVGPQAHADHPVRPQVYGDHPDRLMNRLWMAPLMTGDADSASACAAEGFDSGGRLLARLEARRLLGPAECVAICVPRPGTFGRFGWVARPAGPQSSNAYHLLETGSPTPDGTANRRYGFKELAGAEIAAPRAAASTPSLLQAPVTMKQVETGAMGLLAPLPTKQAAAPSPMVVSGSVPVHTTAMVREVADELIPNVSADAPLMEAGLDSLGTVEFRNRLQARLGDAIELPETLLFKFPTVRQVEAHLGSLVQPSSAVATPAIAAPPPALAQLLGSLLGPAVAPPAQPTQPTLDTTTMVREVAEDLIPGVSADAPLMEAGLDSLGTVEFRNRLQARLGDAIELPETLLFESPTLRQLETHLNSFGRPPVTACEPAAVPSAISNAAGLVRLSNGMKTPSTRAETAEPLPKQLMVAGASGRLPSAGRLADHSSCMRAGYDALVQVPLARWDFERTAYELQDASIASRCQFAGFVTEPELFSNGAFFLSHAETMAMDPQQRMMLEHGYEPACAVGCTVHAACAFEV